jgi:hypothetical protein
MNLSSTDRESIIQKHKLGLSQNAISRELNIPKPYVNGVIRVYRENLGEITGNKNPLPVINPVVNQFSNPHSASSSENYYLKKQIADLEDRLKEYKNDYASEKINNEALRKELAELKIDYNTQEQRHRLELEKRDHAVVANQKTGLNGLIDPIIAPFTKNEKFMEAFGIGLAKMLENKFVGGAGNTAASISESSDPEIQQIINELNQAFVSIPKAQLKMVYEMLSILFHPQLAGLLEQSHAQLVNHAQQTLKTNP